jgi:hypothetical protein
MMGGDGGGSFVFVELRNGGTFDKRTRHFSLLQMKECGVRCHVLHLPIISRHLQ